MDKKRGVSSESVDAHRAIVTLCASRRSMAHFSFCSLVRPATRSWLTEVSVHCMLKSFGTSSPGMLSSSSPSAARLTEAYLQRVVSTRTTGMRRIAASAGMSLIVRAGPAPRPDA